MKTIAPLGLILAFCTAACVTPGARTYATRYSSADVAWSKGVGTGSITGTAIATVKGRTHVCAGNPVSLVPRSAYADENMMEFFGGLERGSYVFGKVKGFTTSSDPAYSRDMRGTTCDANGRFSFNGLPDGTYYVTTHFEGSRTIEVIGVGTFRDRLGLGLMQRVNIVNGNSVDVTLTQDQ